MFVYTFARRSARSGVTIMGYAPHVLIEVTAATEKAARIKAEEASGDPGQDDSWVFELRSIKEVRD